MNFKCYDVVEIQGKRYVVIEVISYQEFIIEKTVNYTLNDEMYNNELGTHKGAKNWTEYGLMPVDGEPFFIFTINWYKTIFGPILSPFMST